MKFFLLRKYLKKIQSHKLRGSDYMEVTITGTPKEIYEFLVGNQKPSQTESFLYALKLIEKERAGESGIPIKFRRED